MELQRGTPANRRPTRRRNTLRLATYGQLDRRTSAYREARRLVGALVSDLGGEAELTAGERELVQRAAMLGALLVDQEAQYLRGERPFDAVTYCTIVNAQRRTLEAIGLKRVPRDVTPRVGDYVSTIGEAAE